MPHLDDNIEDLDPSADPNLDETTAGAEMEAVVDDAKSSDATGENPEDSLLSVVRDAVAETREKSQAASPAEGKEGSEDDTDETLKKQDDDGYTDVPFHKHPRFQHLLRKAKTYEQDATRYQNVQNFLDDAGLTSEEAADGLAIMGMAKTNPAGAWERIKPWVRNLMLASGEVLTDDLKQRVQNGELSQEAALELSRARAHTKNASAAASFREQVAARRQTADLSTSLRTTAQSWENERRAKDPNFEAKYQDVMEKVSWLIRTEGQPNTPEGVRDQLQRAYKAVNDRVRTVAPTARKPAIRPVTGGQVAGDQRPKNASTLDIVRAHRRAG